MNLIALAAVSIGMGIYFSVVTVPYWSMQIGLALWRAERVSIDDLESAIRQTQWYLYPVLLILSSGFFGLIFYGACHLGGAR